MSRVYRSVVPKFFSKLEVVSYIIACVGVALTAFMMLMVTPVAADDRARVDSGETQVLAKIGRREITIRELRVEMGRLGITQGTPDTERFALQSIINRHLLVEAAEKASFHKKPEASLRMKAAQEQALADFYLATASQAPEPSLEEIDDYITANPALFAKRIRYEFLVLSLATSSFDEKVLTPLFSETKDFNALKTYLKVNEIQYTTKPLIQASSSFPREIRDQLARYHVNDNIVIKADDEAQIMKITKSELDLVPQNDWRAIARRLVLEQNAVTRARSLLDSLKIGNSVVYYRPELAPEAAQRDAASATGATTGETPAATRPTKPVKPAPSKSTGK